MVHEATLELQSELYELKRQILHFIFADDSSVPEHRFKLNGDQFYFTKGFYFVKVLQYKDGDAFGELALMGPDDRRSATIICDSQCTFATLSREDFNMTLKQI